MCFKHARVFRSVLTFIASEWLHIAMNLKYLFITSELSSEVELMTLRILEPTSKLTVLLTYCVTYEICDFKFTLQNYNKHLAREQR